MNKLVRLGFFLGFSLSLYAGFQWQGEEYHINDSSQEEIAMDLVKKMSFQGNEAILDIGCGDGKITYALSTLVPDGVVVGVDPSASQIDQAQEFSSDRILFIEGTVQQLPYFQSFDLVTSFKATEWASDQAKAFKIIHCALKVNGIFMMNIPTGITWQLLEAVQEVMERKEWNQYHFQEKKVFFSREYYAHNLIEAGFTLQQATIEQNFILFESKEAFSSFIKQSLSFFIDIPTESQDQFISQVVDVYQKFMPTQDDGKVAFEQYVYRIFALKKG